MRTAFVGVLIIGLSACVAQTGDFKWNSGPIPRQWILPFETTTAAATKPTAEPRPTIPPELKRARRAAGNASSTQQDVNACGYVYGLPDNPFTCGPSSMECYANTEYFAFGCCSGSACSSTIDLAVQTTCLDSTDAQSITTSVDGYTGLCTNMQNPYCMTLQYQDMPGYSVFGCTDSPRLTMPIYYDMSAPTANPSMAVAPSASNSTKKSHDEDKSSGSGTNYGAVIGGVVAGVALGLFIITAALCLRRKPVRHGATQKLPTGTAVSHSGGYQRAPQTPGSDTVPFQYRLPNFSADTGMGTKSLRPYSMLSYGMYDPSLRDFHEVHGRSSQTQHFRDRRKPAGGAAYRFSDEKPPDVETNFTIWEADVATGVSLRKTNIKASISIWQADFETNLHLWSASAKTRVKIDIHTPFETRVKTPIETRLEARV